MGGKKNKKGKAAIPPIPKIPATTTVKEKDLFADSDEDLDPVAQQAVAETAKVLSEAEKLTAEAEALVSAMTAPPVAAGNSGDVDQLEELMRVAKANKAKRSGSFISTLSNRRESHCHIVSTLTLPTQRCSCCYPPPGRKSLEYTMAIKEDTPSSPEVSGDSTPAASAPLSPLTPDSPSLRCPSKPSSASTLRALESSRILSNPHDALIHSPSPAKGAISPVLPATPTSSPMGVNEKTTPIRGPAAVLKATEALSGVNAHDGSPSTMPRLFRVPNGAIMLRATHGQSYDEIIEQAQGSRRQEMAEELSQKTFMAAGERTKVDGDWGDSTLRVLEALYVADRSSPIDHLELS